MSNLSHEIVSPESTAELAQAVRDHDQVLAVGNQTKPALSTNIDATLLSTKQLTGIVEYEPSEFTFTARAGTTLDEIKTVLAAQRQYLPFDPPLVGAGATIGGTVAAGLSGPGRFRYGGVRDFLLGVELVSGAGETIRAGGKVVKNAAGFDIPKLLVGSLGQLGVMTELTFKVFPAPLSTITLRIDVDNHVDAVSRMQDFARARYEFDAIDYRTGEKAIYLRLAGPDQVNAVLAAEIVAESATVAKVLEQVDADAFWHQIREFNWLGDELAILKVPLSPEQFLHLQNWNELSTTLTSIHLSCAGTVAWVAIAPQSIHVLHTELCKLETVGLAIRGTDRAQWGHREIVTMHARVKHAMDPDNKFASHFVQPSRPN